MLLSQALRGASACLSSGFAYRQGYSTAGPSSSACSTSAGSCRPARACRPARRQYACAAAAERREYYDAKEMPPIPNNVALIRIPALEHVAVDAATRDMRRASLAILYDIARDGQYDATLNRKSATTALCMYDSEDVIHAIGRPGEFPNIDLLRRIADEGLEVGLEVEFKQA